jgi:hypothetical protein
MTDILNREITVTVLIAAAPVEQQGFDEVLYLASPGTLGGGFTERLRRYTTAAEVATDLAAGDITQTVSDALSTGFGQAPRTASLAVGRVDASAGGQGQETDLAFGGGSTAIGERFVIDVDGVSFVYTATSVITAAAAAAAIQAGMVADARFDDYTITEAAGTITIVLNGTKPQTGIPLDVNGVTDSAAVTITPTITTAASDDVSGDLDTILAADDGWYGIVSEYKGTGWALEVATFAEANAKLFMAQTASQLDLDGDALALGAQLNALSRDYTANCYHHDSAEEFAYAWAVRKLGVDPDTASTDWAWATLSGITPSPLTITQADNLEAVNSNYYNQARGRPAAWRGTVASGLTLDNRVSIDWLTDRLQEVNTQLLLDASAREEKIPYTDDGFSQVRAVNLQQMETAVAAGHVARQADETTGAVTSPVVTVPRRVNVSPSDEAARRVPVTINALVAGSVQRVATTVYLSTSV